MKPFHAPSMGCAKFAAMKINGTPYRSIWESSPTQAEVSIFDQRFLPHRLVVETLRSPEEAALAIREMHTRGAPLIGLVGAYGVWLGMCALKGPESDWLARTQAIAQEIARSRPTAVNLAWAVNRVVAVAAVCNTFEHACQAVRDECRRMVDEDAEVCRMIGVHALPLIEAVWGRKGGGVVNILTHCNAGWLACADYGTATSPIFQAHDRGIPVHVWVEETRPRNQGALTAWELAQHGVPHTVIVDNAGGHLMQHGLVDLVFVGTDRTTRNGDVANKIGTYLKALAARDNGIPFYVMLPSSSLDLTMRDGLREIPIEERDPSEVLRVQGLTPDGQVAEVELYAPGTKASNFGFDITPARLITGLVTERGVCAPNEEAILSLFPELAP